MDSEGYQLLEPELLDGVFRAPGSAPIAIALLTWVVQLARESLGTRLAGVTLVVLPVNYHGTYPALGLRYAADVEDVAPLVEGTINEILRGQPIGEFVKFLSSSSVNWTEEATLLLAK